MDPKSACRELLLELNNLRLGSQLCDTLLLVDQSDAKSTYIPAHGPVLAASSIFFKDLILEAESQINRVFKIDGVSSSDMVQVLDFIYTGQIPVDLKNVQGFIRIAEELRIPLLLEHCKLFLKSNATRLRNKKDHAVDVSLASKATANLRSSPGKVGNVSQPNESSRLTSPSFVNFHNYCVTHKPSKDSQLRSQAIVKKSVKHSRRTHVECQNSPSDIPVVSLDKQKSKIAQKESFLQEHASNDTTVNAHHNELECENSNLEKLSQSPNFENKGRNTIDNRTISSADSLVPQQERNEIQTYNDLVSEPCCESIDKQTVCQSGMQDSTPVGHSNIPVPKKSSRFRTSILMATSTVTSSSASSSAECGEKRNVNTECSSHSTNSNATVNDTGLSTVGELEQSETTTQDQPHHQEDQMIDLPQASAPWEHDIGEGEEFRMTTDSESLLDHNPPRNGGHCKTRLDCCNPKYDKVWERLQKNYSKPSFRCKICYKQFASAQHLTTHEQICKLIDKKGANYECTICKFETGSKRLIEKHITSDHPAKKFFIFCPHCEFKVDSREKYNEHLVSVHTVINPETINRQTKLHCCPKCNFQTTVLSKLKDHKESQHDMKVYRCTLCQVTFKNKKFHLRHMEMMHSNKEPYKCKLCDFTTVYLETIKSHQYTEHKLLSHPNTKIYQCPDCEFNHVKKSKLKQHRQRLHGGSSYACQFCQKTFRMPEYLQRHLQVHASRSHVCTICRFSTKSAILLKAHYRNKHSQEKPFMCEGCGYTAKSRSNLNKHQVGCELLHVTETVSDPSLTLLEDTIVGMDEFEYVEQVDVTELMEQGI